MGPATALSRGSGSLEQVASMWRNAGVRNATPMQTLEWVRSWAEAYRVGHDLDVLALSDGRSVAIAPLVRSRVGGVRLELGGPADLQEATDLVYSDPSLLPDLGAALARAGVPLRFWRVPADSPTIPALRAAYRGHGIVRTTPALGCPSLPLDDSWADPERRLDPRRRSALRRARRIAEGIGTVTCEVLTPGPDDVDALLDEAFQVEAAGWKGRVGEALAREVREGEFFRLYGRAASRRGAFRVCFLRIGGRAAAMKLAAVEGGRFWLLKMGYSEEYERCSPGTLLLLETIRYAAASRLRAYEFLGGDEPWIRVWGPVLRPCLSIRTYPFGVAGIGALVRDAAAFLRDGAGRAGRGAAGRAQRALERRASRAYVAGPSLEHALSACRALEGSGFRATIGYVDRAGDPPREVADSWARAIDAIRRWRVDCHPSLKPRVLRFSRTLFHEIADRARGSGVLLHFDAEGVDDADETFALIRALAADHPKIGCTLPGRWRRSLADADRAAEMGLAVRVVKGEWRDVERPEPDARAGFLGIVDRIAGRVPQAAVATHDPRLAGEALHRLRSAGTPCELEVLLGYPVHRVLPVAVAEDVPVRVYVPYGHPDLPYALSGAGRNPRILAWALRDLLRGHRAAMPGPPSRNAPRGTGSPVAGAVRIPVPALERSRD